MRQANRTTAVARRLPVTCFYCDERFKRTQERATHIRHYHPGRPYRPDLEESQEEAPGFGAATTAMTTAAPKLGESRPEDMTSKQYLVTAIASIKRRQEALGEQVPELERQLESLRAAQKQMDTERQALETALTTIDGDASEQIQAPGGRPIAGD